jgi:riboflavin kinase/FMN adenylyltransferase
VNDARFIAAIGNFDGVHLGHAMLIARTATFAAENRASAAAVVFEPHPRRFFRPDEPPFLLTTSGQRERLLVGAGARRVFPIPFDAALAALSPADFVSNVLKARLGLAGVVTGAEFRFGAGRSGDAESLARLAREAGLFSLIVEPQAVSDGEEKIGSSAIRSAIAAGDMRAAAAMLGREWSVEGVVEKGAQLGRTLGFPTANLTLGDLIEPRRGVYAVRVFIDGIARSGVANFGRRPTVGETSPLLETHVFDFAGDLYGKAIAVSFVAQLRDEAKFPSLDALKAQIAEDSKASRAILGA